MSMSQEKALKYIDKDAVLCCRTEKGKVIDAGDLEDPMLFDEMVDMGLLEIPSDTLKIGNVLGATLKETSEGLTALTPALVDNIQEIKKEEDKKDLSSSEKEEVKKVKPQVSNKVQSNNLASSMVKIHIGEGKDIDLEFPLNAFSNQSNIPDYAQESPLNAVEEEIEDEKSDKKAKIKTLKREYVKVDEVKLSDETKFDGKTLYINEDSIKKAIDSENLVVDLKVDIITKDRYSEYSNTIMDVQPIAVKKEGEIGSGITRIVDGAVIVVTGTDERGVQIGEFGSSEGEMDRNMLFDRAGSPDFGDILIKTNVTIKEGTNMERPGPMAAHKATDIITQEIRDQLKLLDDSYISRTEEFNHERKPGKKKLVIVKEIMGQGAMHDNFIMPNEPVGTLGARANVDLGNIPVVVNPLQILDGCIHALTCIGPASKETSRHYFREPLVLEALNDKEYDLCAVVLVGSPQANTEKFYVSNLLGTTIEAMDVDGAIVTTEGFGNNHIDFASHIDQIGKRDIPVVGMTFAAVQGKLVIGNEHMDAMVDLNKSRQGIENEILQNNCLAREDAVRALEMLRAKINGDEIEAADREYEEQVKLDNLTKIEEVTGEKIELVKNETSLKMSEKRKNIYEKDE